MVLARLRFLSWFVSATLVSPFSCAAFDTPLSDSAVREAYFMGQRRDESVAHFFDKYTKPLPPPQAGPYISSVTFMTAYALLAQLSSQRPYGYSAQQAELDHRKMVETVQITVQIQLTDTYGSVIPNPTGQTTGTPWDSIYRPSDFWRDFQIQVISDKKVLSPIVYTGEPNYICGDSEMQAIALGEYCTLTGATIQLEFLSRH